MPFVKKGGCRKASRVHEAVSERVVDEIAEAIQKLINSLAVKGV